MTKRASFLHTPAGQRFSYGDEIVPSFTVYQADGTPLDQGGSLFSGNLSCERPLSYPPVSVSITAGDLRLVSPSHCFTVAQGETLQIDRRRIQVTASDDAAILSMVSCGLGVSILSSLSLAGYEGQVKTIPLEIPVVVRVGVAIKSLESASTSARRFVKFLKNHYGVLESN